MPDANAVFERLTSGPLKSLDPAERAVFRDRVDILWDDCLRPLHALYGERSDFARLPQRFLRLAARAYAGRPRSLREWDLRRLNEPDGFQSSKHLGYLCDAANFAGDLKGVSRRAAWFEDLGVTCVHLLPVLKTRDGDNDHGRAVSDHRRVDAPVGTMGDLAALARRLRRAGIALGTDVVVDRTAREHTWARKALAGDGKYRDYYLNFPNRELPDQFERTVADVCPGSAGNFTWVDELDRWVWTSYQDYQWDLDYSNPDVFAAMLENLLFLANRGTSVVRLTGVDRLWKTLGTACVGLPETDLLLQAWRALCRVAAPGVVLWAQAGDPETLPPRYLGHGIASGRQAQLASHNTLTTMLWSSIAEQNTRLATQVLSNLPDAPENTAWVTRARGHRAIDWQISHRDADAVGLGAAAHRQFLAQFYSGEFPGSYGRGRNAEPASNFGDWRTHGSLAALAGLNAAIEDGDEQAADVAFRRMAMVYGVVFAFGGIPFVAAGDEMAAADADAPLDWDAAGNCADTSTAAGRAYALVAELAKARRRAFMLHAAATTRVVGTGNDRVLGVLRNSARGRLLVLANSADEPQTVNRFDLGRLGLPDTYRDWLVNDSDATSGDVTLAGYQCLWLSPA